eukprot:CAMPEP_0168551144 /NCGR_PEP_ID=MMETSP0413-20121227/6013_1 /TAXON_ID=136452 /ORGANISM="Filamoeba nolandi, Strain NC-AS-23-1" /LENGTH=487 /DNA_ID=CAMNT_0008581645 /DNA_START=119 /DNA_END=1579 /DNA_ORIENTATION=+
MDASMETKSRVCALIWHEEGLTFDWAESNNREKSITFPTPQLLQNNGTVYAHCFFTRAGYSPDPSSDDYDPAATTNSSRALNRYLPRKKAVAKVNLISGEVLNQEELQNQSTEMEIISYWKPNLTLHLVEDRTAYPRHNVPPQIMQDLKITPDGNYYFPVIFFNEFWLFREHLFPVNDTVKELTLTMSYNTISMMKWQMFAQMEQSFQMQVSMGTAAEGESDEFKRMLVETNPYFLALTFVITILHSVFDFLAFRNDISFWKNKKNLEGLSVRTLFWNVVMQGIVFLYLLDNSTDTSWIILISSGVGLAIEMWKIKKAVIVKVDWTKRIPITFEDRESYSAKTKEHDIVAMRYLSYALIPLVIGYAIYSLIYETHKSWWSWVISTLTGCVYTFGFIMMCPQLYLNYKLKSVAHLPWKTFTYKALNTFIDDLFAFIIRMPLMHRISCFRDDIIFLIYLYQRWIYPVDKTRVNEFGQGGEEETTEPAQQ